jgi:hypothetical protein
MLQSTTITVAPTEFHLCFRSLFQIGRGFAFPCDAEGHVDTQHLSPRACDNYLRAWAMVGRELQVPAVEKDFSAPRTTGDCAVYPVQHASVWSN